MPRPSKLTLLQQQPTEEVASPEEEVTLEKLLTLDQVADLLSIGREKTSELVELGLPVIPLGERTMRVRPAALSRWLLSLEVVASKG